MPDPPIAVEGRPVLWLDQGMALEGRLGRIMTKEDGVIPASERESSVIVIDNWMPDPPIAVEGRPVLWLDQGITLEGRPGRA